MIVYYYAEFGKLFNENIGDWYHNLSTNEKHDIYMEAFEDFLRLSNSRDQEFIRMIGNLNQLFLDRSKPPDAPKNTRKRL